MNARIADWSDLQLALAVVRGGTLAGAAAELDVDASTVFRRVRALEARLGTRLFERRGRGWVPTATGELLATRATAIEEQVQAVERAVVGSELDPAGTVRITTTDTLAVGTLGPHIARLREAHPRIRIDLVVDNRPLRLGRGEAEIALRPGPRPTESDVIAKRVAKLAGGIYASEAYLQRMGRPRRRSDLKRHDAVGVDASLGHIPYARFAESVFDPDRFVLRTTSVLAQVAAVQQGIGVAVLPSLLVANSPSVARLFGPLREVETGLWLLFHRDHRRTARIRACVDALEASLGEERAVFEGRSAVVG